MRVRVEFHESSQAPIDRRDAVNTYTKGALFCIYFKDQTVQKVPLCNIWRITESYS